jgi:hypothetical protein
MGSSSPETQQLPSAEKQKAEEGDQRSKVGGQKPGRWGVLLVLPLVLGAIGATNTWDLPTYLGIGVLAWLLGEWLRNRRIRIIPTVLFVLYLTGVSILLYLPFYSHYTTVFNTGVALTYAKTDMVTWLNIWGFFMFAVVSFLLIALVARPGRVALLEWLSGLYRHRDRSARYLDFFDALVTPRWDLPFGQALLLLAIILGVALAAFGYWVIALLLFMVTLAGFFLFRKDVSRNGAKTQGIER